VPVTPCLARGWSRRSRRHPRRPRRRDRRRLRSRHRAQLFVETITSQLVAKLLHAPTLKLRGPLENPAHERRRERAFSAAPGEPNEGTTLLATWAVSRFMAVLDFTIVNVAQPSIQQGLHLPTTTLQWLVSAYAVTCASVLRRGGRMADVFGRAPLYWLLALAGCGCESNARWVTIHL
jgi:hypothetical protein